METTTVIQFMERFVAALREEGRDGTAHVYACTLKQLKLFCGDRPVPFAEVNTRFLKQFEEHMLHLQLSWNSVSTYMRMFRAVYNRATNEGLTDYTPRMFRTVYTGVKSPVKRAIPPQVWRAILQSRRRLPAALEFTRAIFALLFLLRGIPFVDLVFLRRCDLVDNVITYRRRKTGTRITVVVEPEAMALIRRHASRNRKTPFLFPFIKEPGCDEYAQYQRALRIFNHRLQQLADTLNLDPDIRISTYSARHSWATIANFQQYGQELISNAMGHSSVRVTETYFKAFDEEQIASMNRGVIAAVMGANKR